MQTYGCLLLYGAFLATAVKISKLTKKSDKSASKRGVSIHWTRPLDWTTGLIK